jgi:hypothetical protein
MRRIGFIFVSALALVALAVPAVDAHKGSHNTTHVKTATFSARANHADQGGSLKVVAKVKHATKGAAFSATATVHFASGDQTVTLTRHGKSFNASARVPVASDETPGTVPVDVTFEYDGSEQGAETDGTVQADETTDDQGDDQGDDEDVDDQGDDDQSCDPATATCNDDDQGDDTNDGDGGHDDD